MQRLRRIFSFWPSEASEEGGRRGAATAESRAAPPAANGAGGPGGELAALAGRVEELAREVGKLGREQFQVTTLLDGQGATLDELADAWQASLRQRDQEAADLRRALAEIEAQARLGVVRDLLPIADALAESIRSARELVAARRAERPVETPAGRRPRLPGPLRAWLRGERAARARPGGPDAALDAWLEGLLLVERRLLALLERDDVRPIGAVGRPFDPHRHLAVAVVAATDVPDGTVVGEELRGYLAGDRVLRPAEVVVARRRAGDGEDRRD